MIFDEQEKERLIDEFIRSIGNLHRVSRQSVRDYITRSHEHENTFLHSRVVLYRRHGQYTLRYILACIEEILYNYVVSTSAAGLFEYRCISPNFTQHYGSVVPDYPTDSVANISTEMIQLNTELIESQYFASLQFPLFEEANPKPKIRNFNTCNTITSETSSTLTKTNSNKDQFSLKTWFLDFFK